MLWLHSTLVTPGKKRRAAGILETRSKSERASGKKEDEVESFLLRQIGRQLGERGRKDSAFFPATADPKSKLESFKPNANCRSSASESSLKTDHSWQLLPQTTEGFTRPGRPRKIGTNLILRLAFRPSSAFVGRPRSVPSPARPIPSAFSLFPRGPTGHRPTDRPTERRRYGRPLKENTQIQGRAAAGKKDRRDLDCESGRPSDLIPSHLDHKGRKSAGNPPARSLCHHPEQERRMIHVQYRASGLAYVSAKKCPPPAI